MSYDCMWYAGYSRGLRAIRMPRAKKFILDYWMGRCDKENTSWTSC